MKPTLINLFLLIITFINIQQTENLSTGFTYRGKLVTEIDYRNKQELKSMGFELVGEYMDNFAHMGNSKVSLVGWDKPNLINNNIGKFLFVEHDRNTQFNLTRFQIPTENNKEKSKLVYFRVCVPKNKKMKSYLDIFCPFSGCNYYGSFVNSNLSCLKGMGSMENEIKKSISEENRFILNIIK